MAGWEVDGQIWKGSDENRHTAASAVPGGRRVLGSRRLTKLMFTSGNGLQMGPLHSFFPAHISEKSGDYNP